VPRCGSLLFRSFLPALILAGVALFPAATHAQDSPSIAEVVVEGAETLDPERVRALSGLAAGQRLTQRAMQRAIRALWDTDLFDDIALTTRPATIASAVVVVLQVDEAPIITDVQIEGTDKVKTKDVEAVVGLRRGDRLLRHKLRQIEIDIEEVYQGKGYYLAQAEITATRPTADSTAVQIRIHEGNKVAVQSIQFEGNQALSDGDLRDALETETKGFWPWQDGEFMESEWRRDLAQRLPAIYQEHGYLDMRVVDDSLQVDRREGKIRLVVQVEEGPRYTVGNVEIEGNTRFSRTDLVKFLSLEAGDVFNTAAVAKTQEELGNLYADDGFIYARIEPVRSVRPDTTIIDLTWLIREGTPAQVAHVTIKGNTVTHESVIRRHLFVVPGERFRRTDIRNSLLALEGLGFFEPGIVPTTKVADEATGDIDLTFELRERRTGSLTLGAAIGGGTGLSGFLGYEQPNLFGQGKSGAIRWEFGRRNNNIDLSYTDPVFRGKTSMSISFFDINRRFINTSFRQNAIGSSVRLGTPLPWDDATRLYYGYKWQRVDLEALDEDDTRFQGEYPRIESSVTLGLVRDTRLPRIHPIQGARHSLTADLAGGPLAGNVGFQKFQFETSWYAPTINDRTVLNLSLEGGGINGWGFVPLTEQFLLGGTQFPAEGLRGYQENCVGVFTAGEDLASGPDCGDDRGNAYLLVTAEHFVKITDTIYFSVFYDAGNVWPEFPDITFGDLKRGAGVGLQVDLPGFGPLGLDYAYGFDRLNRLGEPEPKWQLHFRFGNLMR
jgi:outer membrane protein insertion porin family